MRLEILVIAALAALASAAPQWPYRDAVAPYYYGYPGKTPYMYRAGEEDDEIDDMARQDLKVATKDSGSTVTVVEDDESEKADGVRVVETGSAKPLKPVVQSANNNQQQQEQQQPAAASQAQQPLHTNNANNAQQQTSGQPLTVQQPGQQPPAFPPARPAPRPRPPTEQDDDDEEDEESEEDDEDAEDEEDADESGDEEDEEEEDEEERRRDAIAQKEGSTEDSAQVPAVQQEEPQSSAVNGEGSDEVVPEIQSVVVPEPQQPVSQTAVVSNKVNKNKQASAAVAAKPVSSGNNKKKPVSSKVKPSSGAIEALVPGYVTDQGEVLVPVDTVTGSQPITIVPDPFSRPSRIVSGPRPIPQSAIPNQARRQVPYWYRSSPVINPLTQEGGHSPMSGQTLYTAVPPPGSIFTFDDDDDDEDDAEDSPSIIPGNRLRQDDDADEEDEDEDEDDRKKKGPPPPQKVPLAAVPAVGNSGEDDEAEALAFINSGKPLANRRPANGPPNANSGPSSGGPSAPGSGNKKPGTGGNRKPAGQAGSNESESEEDIESEEDEEDEEEDEEDEAAARTVVAHPAQIAASPRGRMYVDEDYVSFPPSRSPTVFAVYQGKFPGAGPSGIPQRRQPQIIASQNPGNPNQRYVVRVTPANRPRPQTPVYYRPIESRHPPNRRVVPIASFDVSVEDTRPSQSSVAVDSDEDSESVIAGGPTPVTSYPFVYKVQGSVQGVRIPSRRPGSSQALAALLGGPGGQQSLAALLGGPGGQQSFAGLLGGRPPRPSVAYYGSSEQHSFSAIRPSSRPGPPGPHGSRPRPPYSFAAAVYGNSPYGGPPGAAFSLGPSGESFSYGPPPSEAFGYGPPPSASYGYGPPPSGSYGYGPPPRPSGSSHGYGPPRPSGSSHSYGPPRPSGSSHGFRPPRPSISSHGRPSGPPVIVRRKQPGGRPQRPPKPHLIAVYNPNGPSSSGPGPREPVEEEYYTFEVPETNNKIVSGGPSKNKRPTVHRKPTPVVHQKQVIEDEEELDSDELVPGTGPAPQQIKIIPQGTVRRRIRGGKQLKPKKNSKKTTSSSSKKQQQDQQDPLGLLSKINKSKSKMH